MRQTVVARLAMFATIPIVAGGAVADVRLTNDFPGGGYVSAYTLATGNVYSDATLAESLRRDKLRWGVAAICIGVGQGLAVVLENVAAA